MALSLPWKTATQTSWAECMELAARARGIEFEVAYAESSGAKQLEQIEGFMSRGVCGVDFEVIDIEAARQLKLRAIKAGIAVMGSVAGPTTQRLGCDFYAVGRALGERAASWIKAELHGRARVIHFIHGQFGPVDRDRGVKDAVTAAGDGVEFIEIEAPAEEETTEGSRALTARLLASHGDVDVWLGPDRMVVGAYATLEEQGVLRPDRHFLGGFDGHPEALEKIASETAYRASIGLRHPLWAYAMGQYMADWLEGKGVPQAISFRPVLLASPDSIQKYTSENSPSSLAASFSNISAYAVLRGNISYDTRDRYVVEDF
jgi:ribose transport system substrate-binding protein